MASRKKTIFISSVQKELQQKRRAIKDFVYNDALLRRFFEVFLFEDLPASDRKADDVYLEGVGRCDVPPRDVLKIYSLQFAKDVILRQPCQEQPE